MDWKQLIINDFRFAGNTIEKALTGLPAGELNKQPGPDSNSIGWVAWHLTRIQDRGISRISGQEQVWIKEGWYSRFNRTSNSEDTGFKHNPQDVAAFKAPDVVALIAYNRAVLEMTEKYVLELTESDLDRKTDHPVFPTLGNWLGVILADVLQHSGQVAYLRGLLTGRGWSDV